MLSKALLLTWEEVAKWFEKAGWLLATWAGDEEALVGHADDGLLILAQESEIESTDPTFELYDGKPGLVYRVRVVPTPRQAAVLLREHGESLRKRGVVPKGLPETPVNGP